MSPLPVAFHDLPPDAFPVVFTFYTRSGRVVYRQTVDEPGALKVPALAKRVGEPVGVRIEYADGRVEDEPPPRR